MKLKLFIFLICTFLLNGCSDARDINSNEVNSKTNIDIPVFCDTKEDGKQFFAYDNEDYCSDYYLKDNTINFTLFPYLPFIVNSADKETFIALSKSKAVDKNNIYNEGKIIDINNNIVNVLLYDEIKDNYYLWIYGNNAYYENKKLPDFNVNKFQKIGNHGLYFADNRQVFYRDKLIKNADIITFEEIESTYYRDIHRYIFAKDKNNIYFEERRVPNVKPDNYYYLDRCLISDKSNIFFGDELISDDYENFKLSTGSQYAYDSEFVYLFDCYKYKKIPKDNKIISFSKQDHTEVLQVGNQLFIGPHEAKESIDQENFVLYSPHYFKYKEQIYRYSARGRPINECSFYYDTMPINAEQESFSILDNIYSRDKKNIFYEDKKVWDADVNSFNILDHEYSRDKNYVYYKENRMIGPEKPNDLVLMGNSYAKDDNYVYLQGSIIKNADPETFQVPIKNK